MLGVTAPSQVGNSMRSGTCELFGHMTTGKPLQIHVTVTSQSNRLFGVKPSCTLLERKTFFLGGNFPFRHAK